MQEEIIKFYDLDKPYGFLGNFHAAPFEANGKIYRTSEHYFQSKKYEGRPGEQLVIDAATPRQAFKLGQDNSLIRRKDWQFVKEDIMYQALTYKFNAHPDLAEKLLSTGQAILVEDSPVDW